MGYNSNKFLILERLHLFPVQKFYLPGLVLSIVGWSGIFFLFQYTLPTLGPRWLFFFLFMLALSGMALPIVAYLHRRFPTEPPTNGGTVLRQAIWVGVYGNILAWLQLGRVLNLALVIFLAVGFLAIEFLMRMREQSRWKPGDERSE